MNDEGRQRRRFLALWFARLACNTLLASSQARAFTARPTGTISRSITSPSLDLLPPTTRRSRYSSRLILWQGTSSSPSNSESSSSSSAHGAHHHSLNLDDADAPPFKALIDGDPYSYREAIVRTVAWVTAAILFGGGLWFGMGAETGQEFFAGYLVEQSLSVDNLFVFLLLFEYFRVPLQFQDRVLNWGIYGAIVMRAIMIGLGAAALQSFHEILLVFAGILVYSSGKFFLGDKEDEEEDPGENSIVQLSRKLIDSTNEFDGDRFFTEVSGVRKATPLLICMVAVEISDVVFAVDSIPAVFGVTENPLVVFSSNIFAIMGLRSLYTILSKAATDLRYLEPAVAIVLGFIGSKMIAEYCGYTVPTHVALAVVATLLSAGVGLSVLENQKDLKQAPAPTPSEIEARGSPPSE